MEEVEPRLWPWQRPATEAEKLQSAKEAEAYRLDQQERTAARRARYPRGGGGRISAIVSGGLPSLGKRR